MKKIKMYALHKIKIRVSLLQKFPSLHITPQAPFNTQ